MSNMTDKEKLEVWETLAHNLQMCRHATMDREKLTEIIDLMCNWSYAHRVGNGELDNDKVVAKFYEKMRAYLSRK